MVKYLLGGVAAFSLMAGFAAGQSDALAAYYVSGNAGVTEVGDSDFTESGPGFSVQGELEFDTGYGLNAAFGREIGPFRVEGEISYREADMDTLTVNTITVGTFVFTGLGSAPIDGDISSLGFMVNGWYDFDTGTQWVPYVGGGVGTAQISAEINSVGSVATSFDESDWVFAYQASGGIGFEINANTTIQAGYRFFATTDPEFDFGGATQEVEFYSHNFEAGIRFKF